MNTSSRKLAFLVTPLMALIAVPASADDNTGWYASLNAGVGTLGSSTLTYRDGTNTESIDASYDAGFSAGGTLGYGFANGWSLEGDILYRTNDRDRIDVPGLGTFEEGNFASLGFGVSALYRFSLGSSGKFTGYAGPGIVYLQEIDIDFEGNGQEIEFETSDTGWQVKLGGRYSFNDRWFLDAGATYLAASGVTMERPSNSAETIETDYEQWTFGLGVGLRF